MNYTRFVILGQERTGSNFLQMLLASHSSVLSFGEIFNPAEEIRRRNSAIAKPLELDDDPVEYLGKYVYKEYPDNVQAVGFRLFYSHARNNEWKGVREYLQSPDIKIIHLKRKNLLDRYLSFVLACRSNMWIALQEGKESKTYNEPVTINLAKCFQDFHRSLWYQEEADDFFQENPKIEVIYEDLCDDLVGESNRIQDFLELELEELAPKTRKQRTRKKSEVIANYDDLEKYLIRGVSEGWAKPEWLDFLNDE